VRRRLARSAIDMFSELTDDSIGCVVGQVDAGAELAAPLSGWPCVFWLVAVEEVGARDWHEIGTVERGVAFTIRDRSGGSARVVPDGARVAGDELVTLHGRLQSLPPAARALFQRADARLNYPGSSSIRLRQHTIAPGAWVIARGRSQREPDPAAPREESSYRGDTPTWPVLSSSRRTPLLLATASNADLLRAWLRP
jgi:hypothetical protein